MDEKLKELESDTPDRLEQTTQGIPKLPEMTADIVLEVQRQQLEALRSENAIINEEIAEAKRIYKIRRGTCDDYEIRLGRDYEGWMPQMVENSVPVLCQMLERTKAELSDAQSIITHTFECGVARMAGRIKMVKHTLTYLLHESGTLEIGDSAADAWAQIILAALDAPLKANTCAPSTEGLLDKKVEDHG